MSKIDWLNGIHHDGWGADVVTLLLNGVNAVDFKFYLPKTSNNSAKLISLATDKQELAVGTLERDVISQFNVKIPDEFRDARVYIMINEPEDIDNDKRWLGVLFLEYRINGGEWLEVVPDTAKSDDGSPVELSQPLYEKSLERQYHGALSRYPLVSIIVTNFNGSHHLHDLFTSLDTQTYKNREIIFVDDNSTDNSIEVANSFHVDKVIVAPGRSGFTGTNNLGFAQSSGELVALINNDVRVEEHWLESLVTRMQSDNEIGAVASKIRFFTKFTKCELAHNKPFEFYLDQTLRDSSYKKVFIKVGKLDERNVASSWLCDDNMHRVEIYLPILDNDLIFHVRSEHGPQFILRLNDFRTVYEYDVAPNGDVTIAINNALLQSRHKYDQYIINNVGTMENDKHMPFDRGFGEIDNGQYDDAKEVPYFCGCSVLIRRDALKGAQLFIDEMFAYFEDSELSLRIRENGYKIVYDPRSVVYHKHSSTTIEYSGFWRSQTAQNSIIFEYVRNQEGREETLNAKLSHLNHLYHWYGSKEDISESERQFRNNIPGIKTRVTEICSKIASKQIPRRSVVRIGVFNPYWDTLGGGEVHALNFARVLCEYGNVELISTRDFDLPELLEYFQFRDVRFIKRIVTEMTSALTGEYDIFVNSCFVSSLVSRAKLSYYIVSFPHALTTSHFLSTYKFLANSKYTFEWMKKRWKEQFEAAVLFPCVGEAYCLSQLEAATKEYTILSVGRFVSKGHIKNQLEVARAFDLFCRSYSGAYRWKLVLIGSVNDEDYFHKVQAECKANACELIGNATADNLVNLYKSAAIYVHASGIGKSPEREPELMEHFGIAVAQGVSTGCVPIVYSQAGPLEIVQEAQVGCVFSTVEEMALRFAEIAGKIEASEFDSDNFMQIAEKGKRFGWREFRSRARSMVDDDVRQILAERA